MTKSVKSEMLRVRLAGLDAMLSEPEAKHSGRPLAKKANADDDRVYGESF